MARFVVLFVISISTSFGDQLVPCENTRHEYSGEPSTFHISVDEVLAVAEGAFHIPVRWRNACDDTPPYFTRPSECGDHESIVHDLHHSETVVHLAIFHRGEPAFISHATEEQPVCAELLRLPVEVSVESDDGVLDEKLDLEISTECGTALGIGFTEPLASLQGRVNQIGGQDTTLWLGFGFFGDRVWFDLYVQPAGDNGWILTSDLAPFEVSPHDIGFSEIGMSSQLALKDGPCPYRSDASRS